MNDMDMKYLTRGEIQDRYWESQAQTFITVRRLERLESLAVTVQAAFPDQEGCLVCGEWSPHHSRGCPVARITGQPLVVVSSEAAKAMVAALRALDDPLQTPADPQDCC